MKTITVIDVIKSKNYSDRMTEKLNKVTMVEDKEPELKKIDPKPVVLSENVAKKRNIEIKNKLEGISTDKVKQENKPEVDKPKVKTADELAKEKLDNLKKVATDMKDKVKKYE